MDIFRNFKKSQGRLSKDISAGRLILDVPDGSSRESQDHEDVQLLHSDEHYTDADVLILGAQPQDEDVGSQTDKKSSVMSKRRPEYNLPASEAIDLAVIFEECADALVVLGRSIGGPEIEHRTRSSIEYDTRTQRPTFATTKTNESSRYTSKRDSVAHNTKAGKLKSFKQSGVHTARTSITELHNQEIQAKFLNKSRFATKQNKNYILRQRYESKLPRQISQMRDQFSTSQFNRRVSVAITDCYVSNFTVSGKLKGDKGFLQNTIHDLMVELIQKSSFNSLVAAIENHFQWEAANEAKINRVSQLEARRRTLARELKKCKSEKIEEMTYFDRKIWRLEDKHQETRCRLGASHNYVVHEAQMIKEKSVKRCKREVQRWTDKKDDLAKSRVLETQVHFSMTDFIVSEINRIQSIADMWIDKYNTDKDNLQSELDILKSRRAYTMEKRQQLEKIYKEKWTIVADHRRILKIEERRRRRTELESRMATRLSSWWRGCLVRQGLGSRGRWIETLKKLGFS